MYFACWKAHHLDFCSSFKPKVLRFVRFEIKEELQRELSVIEFIFHRHPHKEKPWFFSRFHILYVLFGALIFEESGRFAFLLNKVSLNVERVIFIEFKRNRGFFFLKKIISMYHPFPDKMSLLLFLFFDSPVWWRPRSRRPACNSSARPAWWSPTWSCSCWSCWVC